MSQIELPIILLIGHSGVGKTTIINYLVDSYNFKFVRSYTTRNQRKNETPNDYNFIDKATFEYMLYNNEFIEYTQYCNNYYGLAKKAFETADKPLILAVDLHGLKVLKNIYGDRVISFLIKAPSEEILLSRLKNRQGNDINFDSRILENRKVLDHELINFTVINDELEVCTNTIIIILKKILKNNFC